MDIARATKIGFIFAMARLASTQTIRELLTDPEGCLAAMSESFDHAKFVAGEPFQDCLGDPCAFADTTESMLDKTITEYVALIVTKKIGWSQWCRMRCGLVFQQDILDQFTIAVAQSPVMSKELLARCDNLSESETAILESSAAKAPFYEVKK